MAAGRAEQPTAVIVDTGCFRKSRYRGVERTHAQGQYVVAASNLVRMARLMVTAPPKMARA